MRGGAAEKPGQASATRFESRSADWLSCADALRRVMRGARPLPSVRRPVEEVGGLALASSIESPVTLPPWDNSAMDGYAVQGDSIAGASQSHPRYLRVTGARRAGDTAGGPVGAGEAVRPGIARDTEESVREHILRGAGKADLLITIGGASMGEGDLFKRVLDDLGYQPGFWRVRIRPGSPFGFGHLPVEGRDPVPVFGLPGNPASAFVTFHLFVRPFISALAGHRHPLPPAIRARAGQAMRGPRGLAIYPRVRLRPAPDGSWRAWLAGHQSSALVVPTGRADGLAVIPEGVQAIDEGEEVDVLLFGRPGWLPSETGPGAGWA